MRSIGDELGEVKGAGAPAEAVSIDTVREAMQKIKAAKEKIAKPTGEKGDLTKKLRDDEGLHMKGLNFLVDLDGMSEEQRAHFWGTAGHYEALGLGQPKDLFTGNSADVVNLEERAAKVRKAVKPAKTGKAAKNGAHGADVH